MPENEGKENTYVTGLVLGNGCLPHKMALMMLTVLPGLGAGGAGHT